MSEVTRILCAIDQGDPGAAEQLLPRVYEELRKLAAQKLAQEKPGQTLQGTALVHEAYLRLVDTDKGPPWNSRRHFFAAPATSLPPRPRRCGGSWSRPPGEIRGGWASHRELCFAKTTRRYARGGARG